MSQNYKTFSNNSNRLEKVKLLGDSVKNINSSADSTITKKSQLDILTSCASHAREIEDIGKSNHIN